MGDGRCSCFPGFGGADCSVYLCASNCSGHGACIGPFAALAAAATITAAQSDFRTPNASADHPPHLLQPRKRFSAFDGPTHATCQCATGWEGPRCERPTCPNRCSAHGTCMGDSGVCACHAGWKGEDCSTRRCPADPSANECGGATH